MRWKSLSRILKRIESTVLKHWWAFANYYHVQEGKINIIGQQILEIDMEFFTVNVYLC
jgi:hypothetical protein